MSPPLRGDAALIVVVIPQQYNSYLAAVGGIDALGNH